MELVDRAAQWTPLPREHPCRVWFPSQRAVGRSTAAAARPSAPRSLVIAPTPQQASDLPLWLPSLLAQQDVRPGNRVTVDLTDLASVHLTGLHLLLTLLWRRVTTRGDVLLTGGTPGLRTQLASLAITPASCRAAVYGPPPAPARVPAPVPRPVPTGLDSARSAQAPLVTGRGRSNRRSTAAAAVSRARRPAAPHPRRLDRSLRSRA